MTELNAGCVLGDVCLVYEHILQGASVNQRDQDGLTPLHLAVCQDTRGGLDVLNCLLNHGADAEALCTGVSPLNLACIKGHLKYVERLLPVTSLLNHPDPDGDTPLLNAATEDHPAVVQCLIANGAYIDAQNNRGLTALSKAATVGNTICACILLGQGSDVYLGDEDGDTPLHVACLYKHADIARILVQHDAPIESLNDKAYTPLHSACQSGDVSCVKFLLSKGASMDCVDYQDRTPCKLAFNKGHDDIVDILVDNGCSELLDSVTDMNVLSSRSKSERSGVSIASKSSTGPGESHTKSADVPTEGSPGSSDVVNNDSHPSCGVGQWPSGKHLPPTSMNGENAEIEDFTKLLTNQSLPSNSSGIGLIVVPRSSLSDGGDKNFVSKLKEVSQLKEVFIKSIASAASVYAKCILPESKPSKSAGVDAQHETTSDTDAYMRTSAGIKTNESSKLKEDSGPQVSTEPKLQMAGQLPTKCNSSVANWGSYQRACDTSVVHTPFAGFGTVLTVCLETLATEITKESRLPWEDLATALLTRSPRINKAIHHILIRRCTVSHGTATLCLSTFLKTWWEECCSEEQAITKCGIIRDALIEQGLNPALMEPLQTYLRGDD